jgi:trk system potassium uptake protein
MPGLPRGMLIGSVVRNGDVIVPNGNTVLKANDHLVIFAVPKVSIKLDRYFASVEGNGDREQLRNRLFLAE